MPRIKKAQNGDMYDPIPNKPSRPLGYQSGLSASSKKVKKSTTMVSKKPKPSALKPLKKGQTGLASVKKSKKATGPAKKSSYKLYIDDGNYVQKYKFAKGEQPLYKSPSGDIEGGPTKVSKVKRTLKGFLRGAPRVKKNPRLSFFTGQ
jgi:hypothetical protein